MTAGVAQSKQVTKIKIIYAVHKKMIQCLLSSSGFGHIDDN